MDSLDTLVAAPAETLVLGRYRLCERLGAGGFGVVWSAYDEQLQREVAVKRVWMTGIGEGPGSSASGRLRHPRGITGEEEEAQAVAERAQREAQAAARLAHPAIVALYEARAQGEAFYLISELVHGETLSALLHAGELCDEEVLAIGVALAGALEHAHARGVIHRDVKPSNILVPEDAVERGVAVAKLTDFGGARLAGEDALTRTGDVLGTLAYMAPEQSQGREAGPEADLYSLALVLYEALSGVNPVRGANPADTARRIGEMLPPLAHYRGGLPRALSGALDRALAPAPNRRGELCELRGVLESHSALKRHPAHRRRSARAPAAAAALPSWAPAPQAALAGSLSDRPTRGLPRPSAERLSGEGSVRSRAPIPGFICVPRSIWIAATIALVVWQSAVGRPGVALLALAAALPLWLPRRTEPRALVAALAPALGAVGLAGMFPALAGQAASRYARAGLAALGYWWLCLAEPLLARRLWLGAPATMPPREAWEGSLTRAVTHVLDPLLSTGVLLGAALWALAALALPWLVRGRGAALDVVAATMWAAALVTAEPLLDHGLPLAAGRALPRGALLAGVLAGTLAVGARALRGPVRASRGPARAPRGPV